MAAPTGRQKAAWRVSPGQAAVSRTRGTNGGSYGPGLPPRLKHQEPETLHQRGHGVEYDPRYVWHPRALGLAARPATDCRPSRAERPLTPCFPMAGSMGYLLPPPPGAPNDPRLRPLGTLGARRDTPDTYPRERVPRDIRGHSAVLCPTHLTRHSPWRATGSGCSPRARVAAGVCRHTPLPRPWPAARPPGSG